MNSKYIELIKHVLIDYHRMDLGEYSPLDTWRYIDSPNYKIRILQGLNKILKAKKYAICKYNEPIPELRLEGRDWPTYADTMIGLKRIENIEMCFKQIVKNNVQGDFIETGVWRGGATIFMKALLKDANIEDRVIWVADSFEGLPKPNEEQYGADRNSKFHKIKKFAVPLEVVKHNFKKYDLLDDNIKFLKGWFKDTLKTSLINKLALIRLDGDMYESTMDGLTNLYPKLSKGGFIIIDDWGAVKGCQLAVKDYRKKHNITEKIIEIDWTGVYWKKEKEDDYDVGAVA